MIGSHVHPGVIHSNVQSALLHCDVANTGIHASLKSSANQAQQGLLVAVEVVDAQSDKVQRTAFFKA